jgi:phosphatidylserine/phosphatidylglycerophosphate/cardiolipin synthase-like enzyme
MRRIRWYCRARPGLAVVAILVLGASIVVGLRALNDPAEPALSRPGSSAADGAYGLVQLPGDGMGAVYSVVTTATRSVDLEVYELSDPVLEADLVAAHRRGIGVRVVLSQAYHSRAVNLAAYTYLRDSGVPVRWGPTTTILHIKAIVADGVTAVVDTGNFVAADYPRTRDAALIDRERGQVAAIGATLRADWDNPNAVPSATRAAGLLWSPRAAPGMVAEISGARFSVQYTSEEFSDADVYDALAGDARRGVSCDIVMTYSRAWATGLRTAAAAGCRVHVGSDRPDELYFHIKRVIVDAGRPSASLLLGSQNASYTSLADNRELSVRVTGAQARTVIAAAAATFSADFRATPVWSPGRSP